MNNSKKSNRPSKWSFLELLLMLGLIQARCKSRLIPRNESSLKSQSERYYSSGQAKETMLRNLLPFKQNSVIAIALTASFFICPWRVTSLYSQYEKYGKREFSSDAVIRMDQYSYTLEAGSQNEFEVLVFPITTNDLLFKGLKAAGPKELSVKVHPKTRSQEVFALEVKIPKRTEPGKYQYVLMAHGAMANKIKAITFSVRVIPEDNFQFQGDYDDSLALSADSSKSSLGSDDSIFVEY